MQVTKSCANTDHRQSFIQSELGVIRGLEQLIGLVSWGPFAANRALLLLVGLFASNRAR